MHSPFFSRAIDTIGKSIVAKQLGLILLVSFLVLLTLLLSDLFIYKSNDRLSHIVDTKIKEIADNARVSSELHQTFVSVHFLLNDFLSKDIQLQDLGQDLRERLQKSIEIESGHDGVIQSSIQSYWQELDRLLVQCQTIRKEFKGLRLLEQRIMDVLSQFDQFIVDRQLAIAPGPLEEEVAFTQFAIMVPALFEIFYEVKLKTQVISMNYLHSTSVEDLSRAEALRLVDEFRVGLEAVTISWPEVEDARNNLITLVAAFNGSLRQLFLGLDYLVKRRAVLMASENKVLSGLSRMSEDVAIQVGQLREDTLRQAGTSFKVALFAAAIILLLLATIAVIMLRIITPIKALTDGVQRVARGDVGPKVDIRSHDEIGQLATAFNQMTDILKKTTLSRDMVENMVNSLDEMLIVTDETGSIISANTAAYDILAFEEEELSAISIIDALGSKAVTFKDGSGLPGGNDFHDSVKQGLLTRVELHSSVGEEGDRHYLFSAYPMTSKSAQQGSIVCILADISERVLAEKRLVENEGKYRELFEHDKAALMVIDAETKQFEDANRATLELFGYTKQDFLKLSVLDVSAEKEDTQKRFAKLVSSPSEHAAVAERVFNKSDGSQFTGEITPFTFYSDGRAKVVGAVRDLTEKIRLEKQLRQSQKMEAIGTLAGGIAHDFNNILGAIIGFTELALEDSPPESALTEDLQEVYNASQRAKGLVQQILAFSRQTDMERVPMDPAVIAGEVVGLIRSTIPSTIEIVEHLDSKVGLIYANPTQIHQILMNICTNAYHAMEETGGVLGVSLKKKKLGQEDLHEAPLLIPGDFIQFTISDSGEGIPIDIQDKIFDPFFTTKETDRGTGMGLSVVHGLVQGNGGFVTLESETGRGTRIDVFLPSSDKDAVKEADHGIEQIPGGTERILFVDDEPMLAKIGKSMLEKLGYHVTARTNSIDALETFRKDPELYDLIITDQTMPGMTGADLSKQILEIQPTIPIILCTGYSSVLSAEQALAAGIRQFIPKPFSRKELAVIIRRCLDGEA